jgi:hypothetical protein
MTTHAIDTLNDLVATGHQLPQGIVAATQALANPALDTDERVALLALRFDCHSMRMELAQALICESQLQQRLGDAQASLAAAQAALKAARRRAAGRRSKRTAWPLWATRSWRWATTCPQRWPTCSRRRPVSRPWAT